MCAPQMERHRHSCPHATQFRVLRGFFKNASIGVTNRCLKLRKHSLGVGTVGTQKPSERIERELLDCGDRESACPFARSVPTHAVGHKKQMCALLSNLQLRFAETRLPDVHRFGELGDEDLILIDRSHLSFIRDPNAVTVNGREGVGVTDSLVIASPLVQAAWSRYQNHCRF